MLNKLETEQEQEAQSSIALVQSLESEKSTLTDKLSKLLDAHLEDIVDKESYLAKKAELINHKAQISEQMEEIRNKGNNWLEPMRNFILQSRQAKKAAQEGNPMKIRTFLKNIGSNLILKGKKFNFEAQIGWRLLAQNAAFSGWQGR